MPYPPFPELYNVEQESKLCSSDWLPSSAVFYSLQSSDGKCGEGWGWPWRKIYCEGYEASKNLGWAYNSVLEISYTSYLQIYLVL